MDQNLSFQTNNVNFTQKISNKILRKSYKIIYFLEGIFRFIII